MRHVPSGLCLALLTTLPARAQDITACTPGTPILRPIMSTHGLPPYPPMAVPLDEEGVTLLTVTIGEDGAPVDVSVTTSSGATRLDSAAAGYVKATWKWTPPRGPNCEPVKVRTRVSITWSLKDRPDRAVIRYTPFYMEARDYPIGALARKEQGFTTLTVKAAADGKPVTVTIQESSGYPELDARALDIVRSRYRTKLGGSNGAPGNGGVVAVWSLPLPDKK